MLKRLFGSACAVLVLIRCGPAEQVSEHFEAGELRGVNENRKLEETSGLVASKKFPGFMWAHNDSGHDPDLFLLDSTAQTKAAFHITGAKNRDWEDIARLSTDSTSMLFIGDIGDNNRRHRLKVIYCIPEPDRLDSLTELIPTDTLFIEVAGGYRDMEALMADPVSQHLYLISKREQQVKVYEIGYPYPTDTFTLEPVLEIPVTKVTAADISPDGQEILMKNYSEVYYWRRLPGQSIVEALKVPPMLLAYEREPQGESIAWALDGSGYFTLSENGKGERGRLYFYRRSAPASTPGLR